MYYYYVPQVYPYVNYYPVYDTSRQYELYRQQLPQIPSQQPTQDQKPYLTTWLYSNVYYGNYYES